MRSSIVRLLVLALLWAAPLIAQERPGPTANPDAEGYILPPPAVQEVLTTDKNYAELNYAGPGENYFLVPHVNELSTLELMSRETYRLAELELRPGTDRLWHLDTYGIDGARIYSLSDRRFVNIDLPEGAFASDFTWSADGRQIAFLAHLPTHTEVWVAESSTGRTRSLSDRRVLATLATSAGGQGSRPSQMLQWTPGGTILTLLVPAGRGAEPVRNPVPSGPVVRRTRDEATRTRTYPNLLEDAHDEDLFEFYTTSQLVEIGPDGVRAIGPPRMYQSISASPDGTHVLTSWLERPFSYITSYRGFPNTTAVLDRNGAVVSELEHTALREGGGGSDGNSEPRDFAWRPDGGGLTWLQRAPREPDADANAPRPDRVFTATAPFSLDQGRVVARSDDPIDEAAWTLDGRHILGQVGRDGKQALVHWAQGRRNAERHILIDFHDTDDPTDLPGELMTLRSHNGLEYAALSSNGRATFIQGDGYGDDFRPQPFVDRVSLSDGATTRVFEGSRDTFDQPLVPLNADMTRMIASREDVQDFPDSFLWEDGRWGDNLTENVDPFPAVTAARRMDFSFERRDGVEVQGRVSMPVGWREGDPPVPAIFWTYPREYEESDEYENAAIRARNRNAFTHMSWLRWSDIWLTQGYALVYPDIPIIGENYNDTYIGALVDAMYGAIRAVDGLGVVDVDRIGHGGHSYGAFATANILANAPFFKAGIAGDGAYNRSLTPDGFQAERRSIWEAPSTYIEMSPFFKADQIDTPLLMYHGGDDNNSGTFPIQSRRMISALTILGKEAVLYEYPYESHTPRAIENKMDMWARFIDWFDTYVKEPRGAATISPDAGMN